MQLLKAGLIPCSFLPLFVSILAWGCQQKKKRGDALWFGKEAALRFDLCLVFKFHCYSTCTGQSLKNQSGATTIGSSWKQRRRVKQFYATLYNLSLKLEGGQKQSERGRRKDLEWWKLQRHEPKMHPGKPVHFTMQGCSIVTTWCILSQHGVCSTVNSLARHWASSLSNTQTGNCATFRKTWTACRLCALVSLWCV